MASGRGRHAEWVIEPLGRDHERGSFDCGEPALNEFLKKLARQQQEKNVGRTFVAVLPGSKRVLGFYTLSAGSIAAQSMPANLRRKIPKYPVPVARLGRLAVDLSVEGKGLGSALLRDALLRAARIATAEMGIVAVVVDAKNEAAKKFYERYGFIPFPDSSLSLFMLTATIQAGMGTA
jgi:ribosomal protein S18 acetylase RimI-like enzyme